MDLMSHLAQLPAYMAEQVNYTIECTNLDYIYDNEPLGFEYSSPISNDLCNKNKKFEVQGPLEEDQP